MKFSMVLLFIIVGVCIWGSTVSNPSDFFRQWWVIVLTAVLCVNLLLCSVRRVSRSLANYKRAEKRRAGAFGTWLCHFGMMLVIIGFAAGQFLSREYVCYGIPGSIQPVGDTGLMLQIDDFDVLMRDDYTVEQYIAKLSIFDKDTNVVSGESSVNHPLSAYGYEFYQDSLGWAAYIDTYKDQEYQRSDIVCVGEYTYPDDRPELKLFFSKFYTDLGRDENGQLTSLTPLLNNPHALFTVYYRDQMMGMDVTAMDTPVTVNEYQFVFRDPTEYTLIVIKRDPTALLVGAASLIMLAGIFMSFYYRPVYPAVTEEIMQTPENE